MSKRTFTGLLGAAVTVVLLTGCVAFPPLITVKESGDSHLRSKVDDLERRVQRLEDQNRK